MESSLEKNKKNVKELISNEIYKSVSILHIHFDKT